MRVQMNFAAILFSVLMSLTAILVSPCAALAAGADEAFRAGVSAYQKGDLAAARHSFSEGLQSDPENAVLLFNLGLTEQRSSHPGLALALWRKALAAHPTYRPAANAIEWAKTKLEHGDIPHEVENWESFRTPLLTQVPYEIDLVLCALFLFLAGWFLLSYLGARRRAVIDELRFPSFPVAASVFSLLFFINASLAIAKTFDMQDARGTIVAKKIEALSTPDQSGVQLFDLYEGLEVIMRQSRGKWAQVTYPGGSTGWIPRSALFATSDRVSK